VAPLRQIFVVRNWKGIRFASVPTLRFLWHDVLSGRPVQSNQEDLAMSTPHVRTIISMAALCVLTLNAGIARAEQKKNSPEGDIKPAQTDSPGANPVSRTDNKERQATDSQNNNRQRRTSERNRANDTSGTAERGERNNREGNLDRQLAACLLTKNKGEVELGKFASERAKDGDVKKFAEQMVKDHGKVVEKLEQIVGSQEPNDRRSQIGREIDEQCLASLKQELGNKSEKEFDACYVGSQISGHMQMAAALKVLSNHTSGQLKEIVQEARPTVDKHLEHAKKLMDQLDKSRDHAQASKDRSDRTR
jgi:putative membrane protein